jgi:hypothetical protein
MGTDYPYPWVSAPIDHVLDADGLSDADAAILEVNALTLLGLGSEARNGRA